MKLRKLNHFKAFSEQDWRNLDMESSPCSFKAGEVIFKDGAKGDEMYIVLEGEVQVHKNVSGRDVLIASLGPGEIFGEMAILENMPRSAEVRAKSDSDLLCITAKNLERLQEAHELTALKLMDIIIRVLSNRLRQANKNLEVISFWIE